MSKTCCLILYPNCSTCQKAKRFLLAHHVNFTIRHIVEDTPNVKELKTWIAHSDIPLTKLFNTNGQVYRSLRLKERIKTMSKDEILALLASNGMLIKRPLLIYDDQMLIGFQEKQWELFLKKLT